MELGLDSVAVGGDDVAVSVSRGQWFQDFLEQLQRPALLEHCVPSEDFYATLRPYQQEGLNWLSKLVKQLHGKTRIVMTGTPIENSVSDLWSLFDFLNPGLLGNLAQFKKFNKALKESPQGYGKL